MIYTTFVGLLIFVLSIARGDLTGKDNIKFLIADEKGIWAIGDAIDKPTLILEASDISSFDYHAEKNLLFYNNDKTESIYSWELFGKAEPKLIISNSQRWSPASLAVDFINDKLYILDRHSSKLDIYDLDGNNRSVIVGSTLTNPWKILLDPYSGLMFFNNYDALKRLDMDGTDQKFLASNFDNYYREDVFEFGIDYDEKLIFWGNQSARAIYSMDYDGKKLNTLLTDEKLDLKSLSLSLSYCGKKMYLLYNSTLEQIAMDDGKLTNRTLINLPMINKPKLIRSFIKHPLNKIKNPCMERNGGCQQLCTLKPDGNNGLRSSCSCKPGYQLLPDLSSCEPVSDFIIMPYNNYIKSYSLYSSSINSNQAMYPIAPKGKRWYEFGGIGCDTHERQIYFNAKGEQCMHRTRMNDSVQETFFCGNKERLWDLTFDWVSKNVYYTSYNYDEQGKIQVINPRDKSKIKTVLENLFRPNKLVVHPNKGYIFFVENYFSPNYSYVNRINTDGSDLRRYKDSEISKIDDLAIDFKDDKLYWVDAGFHEGVKYMDFDGKNIKRLDTKYTDSPMFLDVYKDHVFLTVMFRKFYRLDKITGEMSKDISGELDDHSFYGFRVCDKNAQKLLDANPCLKDNGGCDDFCFTVPKNNSSGELTKVCGCSDGKILGEDGKTCVDKKKL